MNSLTPRTSSMLNWGNWSMSQAMSWPPAAIWAGVGTSLVKSPAKAMLMALAM